MDNTELEDQTLDEETEEQSDDSTEVEDIEEPEEDSEPVEEEKDSSDNPEEPEEPDYASMSDEEFEAYMAKAESQISSKKETATENEKEQVEEPKPAKSRARKSVEAAEIPDSFDYKAAYESLFKPFKANGKEIAPRSMEDIVSLMQMGANYTKKMQLMAPMKRAVESLNKAGINEEELNFLIDVHRGDKEAIKALLKRNEIDPMDVDLEDMNYRPNANLASDEDVEFSDALQDAHDSLPRINEILKDTWDAKSKEQLLQNPALIRGLHEEIQMGRFDGVQKIVESEKMFGRYKGVSDIDAYIDVVTKLVAQQQQQQGIAKPQAVQSAAPRQSKPVPDKSKAAPTRAKAKSSKKSQMTMEDLFSLSDEEFEKLSIKDII